MDINKRRKKGGNMIALVELDSSNAIPASLTAGTNCIVFKDVEESNSPGDSNEEILRTEDTVIADVDQEFSAKTVATLLENNEDKLNFIFYLTRGKKYLLIRYRGTNAANHEELFAIVRVKATRDDKAPKGKLPFEATHIAPDAAAAFDSDDMTAIETALSITIRCTAATIPAGQEDKTVKTAVS